MQNSPNLDPLSVDIANACRLTGLGRTKLYELIDSGAVQSVKVGKRRLVTVASIRSWLDQLAKAQQAVA